MTKRAHLFFLGSFVAVISRLLVAQTAFADAEPFFYNDTPYVTHDPYLVSVTDPFPHFVLGDDGPIDFFSMTERPNLALHFSLEADDPDLHRLDVSAHFKYEGQDNVWGIDTSWHECSGCGGFGDANSWMYLSPDAWFDHVQPGGWTVSTEYSVDGNPQGSFENFFHVNGPTVTPEPASMALFGLGAGALALARKRKKSSK